MEGDVPRLLDTENFAFWKKRFETFVKAKSIRLWRIIEFGDYIPTIREGVAGWIHNQDYKDWSEEDIERVGENYLAKHLLYCALPEKEFKAVFTCDAACDIWKTLKTRHEGSARLKKYKVDLLVKDFEAFKKGEYESIDSMFERYNHLITSLVALGEQYTKERYIHRFLDALPSNWDISRNILLLTKNPSDISLVDIVGDLKVYEIETLKKDREGYFVNYY